MTLRDRLAALREYIRPFYLRHLYFPLYPGRKPRYFDDCWKFPDYHVDSQAPGDKPVLVFLPMNDWHTRMQRTQHLALALGRRGYRCLYLNPHLGRQFPGGRRSGGGVRVNQIDVNVIELHVRLPREPVFHHRTLTQTESTILAEAIGAQLVRMRAQTAVQLVAFPVWIDVAVMVREQWKAPIVYDCHDYLPGFAGIAPTIVEREAALFETSDLVLCSAEKLMERARAAGVSADRQLLLRNAAAPELLNVTSRRAAGVPVVIGYIGALDAWFDAPCVQIAAEQHPEWHFQLIGRIENDAVAHLATLPNIELVGEVPFGELGRWLSGFTVAVIPFVINALIQATDPIKLYEYFAAGLPVVASELPELARFGDLLLRYKDNADFARKLETSVANRGHDATERRRAVARSETWDARAADLDGRLTVLDRKGLRV